MNAYAMHLLGTEGAKRVPVHPDCEHCKQFDFSGWLGAGGVSPLIAPLAFWRGIIRRKAVVRLE